jgi:hypothetical protein
MLGKYMAKNKFGYLENIQITIYKFYFEGGEGQGEEIVGVI